MVSNKKNNAIFVDCYKQACNRKKFFFLELGYFLKIL